ncbi:MULTISPECIES: type II secretion system F family protein [unclassified Rhizobium]|uniref:type II secretion system F family protein n=1 Tax=unclassified Rhizobium TaxID=2613769 RepID=UPI00104F2761|nr:MULTISPECIES: type II secretion system F family protein [unclassified Rhizobium]MBB3396522.1 general secretion pathway protein F [Rhizobium sp. BK060]MBB4170268.1 general secretion pathway protein F [Rhizobium sp. BK538]TCM76240.1 general secretion pathway protein F [Rhizobium sp. BK068]
MPNFRYRAIDLSGQMLEGVLQANSSALMAAELERRSLLPVDIEEVKRTGAGLSLSFQSTPSYDDVTAFTEDLAALLSASVALDRALQIIHQSTKRHALSNMTRSLWEVVSKGHSFAEAIAAYPAAFPQTYIKMVEVAEVAGNLDVTLQVIAQERRRGRELRQRLTSALAYPAFLVLAAAGVMFFVLTVVIPEFDKALVGMGQAANGPTSVVFALSRATAANSTLISAMGAAALCSILFISRSKIAKTIIVSLIGHLPGFDTLLMQERAVVFCSTFAMLNKSGVDLPTSLRLIRGLMRDGHSAELVADVLARVRDGSQLTDALSRVAFLPPYGLQMLRVGETTGDTGKAALRVATYYETRLDRSIARATAIIGPLVLLTVSALIAWIIVSVITALLSLNELLL